LTTRNRRQNRPPIKKHIQPDCDLLSLSVVPRVFSLSTCRLSKTRRPISLARPSR
jgi:hypothetical protein